MTTDKKMDAGVYLLYVHHMNADASRILRFSTDNNGDSMRLTLEVDGTTGDGLGHTSKQAIEVDFEELDQILEHLNDMRQRMSENRAARAAWEAQQSTKTQD